MKQMSTTIVLLVAAVIASLLIPIAAQSQNKKKNIFAKENLTAWCIVPFDSENRTPAQRIEMLKRLGFTQYAYDWRHQHISTFAEEIDLAKKAGIKMMAVWIWIDKNSDRVGQLSEDNEQVLKIIKDSGLKTKLWVGFNNNFFADETDDLKVTKGVAMLNYLRDRAGSFVEGVALYNHGDWFGEPENEIRILKELNNPFFGMVYSFHHGHHQMENFPSMLKKMKPYLWTVNINGMKKEGPQILPVGNGDNELAMLKALEKSGYQGTIGILGHIETEDVEKVLQRNLDGLDKLQKQLQ
jgi:sugar phosphate isomerase/epimerase